jgi:hypothetical protein
VVQMCCLSQRSGALQLVKQDRSGILFLRHGAVVHAETTARRGRDAFWEIASWDQIEFAYDRSVRPPVETINESWDKMLMDFLEQQKASEDEPEERRRA